MQRYAAFFAAALACLTTGVHIFVGTPEVKGPLFASSLAAEPALLLYACWHLVSCALAFGAAAFAWAAFARDNPAAGPLVRFVSLLWLAFGLVFVAVDLAQPDGGWLFILPQWALLLPVGALGLWSASGKKTMKMKR